METTRSSPLPLLLLAALPLVIIAVLILPHVQAPAPPTWRPNGHALQKHGADAQAALDHIRQIGARADYCKYECPDQRTRYACSMGGNQWAIAVFEAGRVVTSYITEDQGYVQTMTDGCDNPWRMVHP